MTSLAVGEKPETQTESEASNLESSEGQQATATQGNEVQPNSESSSQEGERETTPPDPREQRLTALKEAEREEARLAGREETLTELQQSQLNQQRQQLKQKARNTYITEMQALDNLYLKQGVTAGELVQAGKNALNNLNKVNAEIAEETVAEQVRDIAFGILPKAAQETLNSLVNTGEDVDLPTYLNHWVETAALHTKAVKSMSLEDAAKASPKLKRELEKAKLEAYDEGKEWGLTAPAGTSPDKGRSSQRSAPGMKTYIQLEEGYNDGSNSKAEDQEYLKLRAQKSKAR